VLLRKKLAVLLATALLLVIGLIFSAPAFAERGGSPNEKACRGQTVSTLSRIGLPPPEVAGYIGEPNAGGFLSEVKNGDVVVFLTSGAHLGCGDQMLSQAELRGALIQERPIPHGRN
jgi:hypothetical protein